MMVIIISIVSLILDGVLSNFFPYIVGNLSIFTPMFTVTTVLVIYPLFCNDNKKYFIYSFILGFIYDLFFTNLLFYDSFIFLLIAYIIYLIYKNFDITSIKILIYIVLVITLYESIFAFFILIFNLVPITFTKLIYKISHSILINLVYGEIINIVILKLPKKYHTRKINAFSKKI